MRVLSLQSHVVYGYVGNKSATFPLQVLGFDVDAVNSVQFSNHTGYAHVKGQVLNSQELEDLIQGLIANDLTNHYTHLLTGYIGSVSFLRAVKNVVNMLKKVNSNLIYVCDPVMGDNGKMYVSEDLLPIYREEIIPLADIITPNQYEAELLSKQIISTERVVLQVCDWFHSKGVKSVVLSSSNLGSDDVLIGLASSVNQNGSPSRFKIAIPRFDATFTGTGDLFAALYMAWMHFSHNNVKLSLEKTICSIQSVLKRTLKSAKNVSNPADVELKLVQSLDDIRNPTPVIQATEIIV